MPKSSATAPPCAEFPFALTSLYDHVGRDSGGYLQKLGALAAQAWSAESGYGMRLWQDYINAYSDLVLAPYAALANIWSPPAEPAPERTDEAQSQP